MLPDNHPAYRQADESLTAWCERVLDIVERQENALKAISLLNGNIDRSRLECPGGPNDSVHRGIMAANAIEIALEALKPCP